VRPQLFMMMMMTFRRLTRRSPMRVAATLAVAIALAGGFAWRTLRAQGNPNNPIVVESAKTGDAHWDQDGNGVSVIGSGDPTIQGFATDISVNTGQTIGFKISAAGPYAIDIYRLGQYANVAVGDVGPAGARKVATLGVITPPAGGQPGCAGDTVTGLVDCGTWSQSASWQAVENGNNVTSGIYIAKLTLQQGTKGSSFIIFVVRDDARQADVVVQTSDTTWQAYNPYGGASLYCAGAGIGVSNFGTEYSCTNRATKVSYNRPFTTRDLNPQNFVFATETPMLRWLESNGYDVKYISGVDTDRLETNQPTASLKILTGTNKPKVFISSGHDEYWSGDQRAAVEAARAAGVSLAFFSGNEMFWKTRYESNYRTLVAYKETLFTSGAGASPAAAGDATGIWTGSWRDNRYSPPSDGGRPENAVTGTMWSVNSGSAAIQVPASMAGLRIWRNTRVAALTSGQVATLAGQTLGYEWDEDFDNGARPDGLMRLSQTTVSNVQKITDFGANLTIGTATHAMTMYKYGTALVFGAGTVQWSWGLNGAHDQGGSTPDAAMQQATVNLLADMGAQPGSLGLAADGTQLQFGVQSSDAVPPTSAILFPAPGGQAQSGNPQTIMGSASDSGGVVAAVEVSTDGGATWHLATGTTNWSYVWTPGFTGSATLKSRAIDDSGNRETPGPGTTVNIMTGGGCQNGCSSLFRPTDTPVNPTILDSEVEVGVKFKSDVDGFVTSIRFYKGGLNTGAHVGTLWTLGGTSLGTVTFTNESTSGWQQANFTTPIPITANTTYVASYHSFTGYATTPQYFANGGVDSPPLHAQSSVVAGGNGVFRYGPSAFPNQIGPDGFGATNYYVDVVFAQVVANADPLQINNLRVQVIDSSSASVSWTTSHPTSTVLNYSPDPSLMPPAPVTTLKDTLSTTHSFTLTGLTANAPNYFNVAATDQSGNVMIYNSPGFTVPGTTIHDTAYQDFAAPDASRSGVYVTQDGSVVLPPSIGSNFDGTSSQLPQGWVSADYNAGASVHIVDGILEVDGARVATCVTDTSGNCVGTETPSSTTSAIYGPGRAVEFRSRFSNGAFQHAGFAQTMFNESEPWAVFTTAGGGALFARTNTGGNIKSVALGSQYLGSYHIYRIDWQPARVRYYIDGALVDDEALSVPGPLRLLAASDFSVGDGDVWVDWIWMVGSPFTAGTGTFVSRVFNANSQVHFGAIQWNASTPAGTSVTMAVRAGNTPTPDGTWSGWTSATNGAFPLADAFQYVQYMAVLSSSDPSVSPELDDVTISNDQPPVAVDDVASTPINWTYQFSNNFMRPTSLLFNDSDPDTPMEELLIVAVSTPAHGTATQSGNGVTYTPAQNFAGDDTFTYTISDGLLTSTAAVTVHVVNQPPTALPDQYTLEAGTGAHVLDPLTNDTHSNASPTPMSIVSINHTSPLGTVSFVPGGTTITYTPLSPGTDTFTYVVADGIGSSTGSIEVDITAADTTTAVTSSLNPSTYGQSVTFTAAVAVAAGTVGTPNGTVVFKDGALVLGSASLDASGNASFATSQLGAGAHSITAAYQATTLFNSSTSAALTQQVNAKAASVTPNAESKTYGTADPAFGGTLSGFLASDGVTATYSRTTGESVAGGPYTISATLSPAAVLSNYVITYNTASFTINKATASVTPNAASKIYGAADPAFSGTLSGF